MPISKTLTNGVSSAVDEALDGFLLSRPDLCRLATTGGARVVCLRDIPADRVAVVSGGGAGHEPAHVGLVADGMLSAAVCGDVFASPPVNAVLDAIRHVGRHARPGVLLVVKNYTGDRLAFGLAAELAIAEGLAVKVVFVADDAAVDGGAVVGRRGIAGTVLVHKCAAAVAQLLSKSTARQASPAAADASMLETVFRAAQRASQAVVSMGASLTVCSIPGVLRSNRLDGLNVVEFGLGIHGEPGARVADLSRVLEAGHLSDDVADEVVAVLVDRMRQLSLEADSVVMLVNNLGGLSNLELSIFSRSCFRSVQARLPASRVVRLYQGHFMTSLDMKGVSVTMAPAHLALASISGSNYSVLFALDAPTLCPVWPSSLAEWFSRQPDVQAHVCPDADAHHRNADRVSQSDAMSGALEDPALAEAVRSACDAVRAAEQEISRLDAVAGDGDAGASFSAIAAAALSVFPAETTLSRTPSEQAPPLSPWQVLRCFLLAASRAIGNRVGGTSGVLYAVMFSAAANSLQQQPLGADEARLASNTDTGADAGRRRLEWVACVSHALDAGCSAMQNLGRARAGDRTMLDALLPVCERLREEAAEGARASSSSRLLSLLSSTAATARASSESTKNMPSSAGRASYVDANVVRGNADAGAAATAVWISAVCETLIRRLSSSAH